MHRKLVLFALFVVGCIGPGHGGARFERDALEGPAPWTDRPVADAPEDFHFALVTDRTGEHRDGIFEEAMEKLNLLQPAFVVSVGDLIEGYSEDRAVLTAEWDEFEGFVDRLSVPFFYAAGNHDYSNATMASVWRERFGPSFYRFRYKGVLFVVLNSELFSSVSKPGRPVEGPDTQAAQMEFVRRTLAEPQARFTFVLVHQPLWDRAKPLEDWLEVESLLGERPYSVFAGHFHRYTKQVRHDRRYITLATTGGGSRMRGFDRGEFDHVALVSMTASGPVIANLMLDGIQDEDVRTERTREMVNRLDRAITPQVSVVPPRDFRAGEVRFQVTNEAKAPLVVRGEFEAGADLVPRKQSVSLTLEPGATQTVAVPLRALRPLDLASAAPALAHWTLETDQVSGKTVSVELESWLLPESRFEAARARRPVVVDGALEEWPPLRFAAQGRPSQGEGIAGPDGGSFRFGVSYDAEFVYVAVDAVDPTPYNDAARSERDQDAISVVLDARPDPERSANEPFFSAISSGSMRKLVFAWLTPVEARPDPIFRAMLPELPEGARRAVRTTPRGFSAELAIPRAWLDEKQGGPWQAFRLDVGQQDFDAEGREHVQHVWRPSRFGTGQAMPIPGSGTFVRSGR